VFIHGGGLTGGSGSFYPGDALAASTNSVVVTFNYRLGIFGFFYSSAVLSESAALNFGYQDMRFALQWVKQNIAAFGGNPNSVLLIGHSAGGASVYSQIAWQAHSSANLFQKAMVMSPALYMFYSAQALVGNGDQLGAGVCGGSLSNTAIMSCLRSVPAGVLLNVTWLAVPVIDGQTVFEQPVAAFVGGRTGNIPLMLGFTVNEGLWSTWWVLFGATDAPVPVPPLDAAAFGQITAGFAFVQPYPNATTFQSWYADLQPIVGFNEALYRATNDSATWCGSKLLLDAAPYPIYRYTFTHATAQWHFSFLSATISTHHADLAYLFGRPLLQEVLTSDETQLSVDFRGYVDSFHRYGTPNNGSVQLPQWPRFSPSVDSTLSLEVNRQFIVRGGPPADRCAQFAPGFAVSPSASPSATPSPSLVPTASTRASTSAASSLFCRVFVVVAALCLLV